MDDFAGRFSRTPSISLLLQWTLAVVGAFWLCSKLLSLGRLLQTFILSGTSLRRYGKPGSWAVVTGASDGLGREYATQLAAEGFSLVLISRTKSKLESVAADIEENYGGKGLEIKILAMDFSKDNDEDYKQLSEMIRGLDVAILINNVGQSHSLPVSFLDTPRSELQDIVTINCLGTLKVTQIVGPILKQRKNGLILTMGSFAGWGPSPFLATYSGSKAFLQQWNNALASELSDDHVDVYLVLSHLVTTSMSKVRRPNYMIPTARDFVKSALGKVGLDGYQYAPNTYTPWWTHAFALWAIENFLGANSPRIISYSKKVQQNVRSRALRKRDREAKKQ